ncbi:Lcl C-terminal domain-containing protein [Acinetobacter tjernbergiae]|uniref:Lcl C-terminal domain-containing protein n=1 Tax=Acinetobacter tjernbergiae TaxID=202955 RepID=UPI001D176235|nr:DUF1566 domain-containing protein [Acinetobacter tjernbergiae]
MPDFFSSSAELAAIEHFLHLIAKTNTFDQRLDVLQEQLRQSEQLQKKSEQQMAQNKQQYQQEINKLTQKNNEQLNKKIADLERRENKYRQEIEQLRQKIENTKTENVQSSQRPKTQTIHSNNELEQGVWIDPKTGLMWARISIGQEWKNGQCIGEAKTLNWESSKGACKDFRLAGYKDWRLPSRDELKTLMIKDKQGYACPQGVLFQPVKVEWGGYWSGSPYACNSNYAWDVYFNNGYSTYYNKNNKYYVRAVRSGQ